MQSTLYCCFPREEDKLCQKLAFFQGSQRPSTVLAEGTEMYAVIAICERMLRANDVCVQCQGKKETLRTVFGTIGSLQFKMKRPEIFGEEKTRREWG